MNWTSPLWRTFLIFCSFLLAWENTPGICMLWIIGQWLPLSIYVCDDRRSAVKHFHWFMAITDSFCKTHMGCWPSFLNSFSQKRMCL
jgi:hypothetical protein